MVISSTQDRFFSVVYDQWGRCAPTNINQPLQVDIPENSSPRCFQFYISKLAPIMVVAVDSYFDMSIGNTEILLNWNNTKESTVEDRVTTYNTTQLLQFCPGLKNYASSNYSGCLLKITIEFQQATSLTLAVQYANDEIELFDGLQVFMSSPLSRSKAMHFHYNVESGNSSVLVSVRSSTDTRYRMVGRLVSLQDYYSSDNAKIYPAYDDKQTGFSTETTHTGSTTLIVKDSDLGSIS